MRIQAFQNQQIQNRPSFSAYGGVTKPSAPREVFKSGSQGVIDALEYLRSALGGTIRINRSKTPSNFSKPKYFMTEVGDEVTLGMAHSRSSNPAVIRIKKIDGSTIYLCRDASFDGKNIPATDKTFDEIARELNEMSLLTYETKLGEEMLAYEAQRA